MIRPNFKVRVGQITRIDFHESRIELLLVVRQFVPGLDIRVAIWQLCIGRNHAELLLTLEHLLALGVPALVELALVLIAPVLVHLMRSMSCAGREIQEEGLVRSSLLLAIDVGDGLVGDLIAQVASIGANMRRCSKSDCWDVRSTASAE